MIVVIIDYGLSNLTCVGAAVERLGYEARVSHTPDSVDIADKIILPGVGSFSNGISKLRELNLFDSLRSEVLTENKPILGICLVY